MAKGKDSKNDEKDTGLHGDSVSLPAEVWEVMKLQAETILSQQLSIERYSKMVASMCMNDGNSKTIDK